MGSAWGALAFPVEYPRFGLSSMVPNLYIRFGSV